MGTVASIMETKSMNLNIMYQVKKVAHANHDINIRLKVFIEYRE